MSPALVILVTFLAGILVVVGVYSLVADLVLRDRSRVSRRVDEEFRQRQRDQVQKSALFKNLDRLAAEASFVGDEVVGPGRRFGVWVEQSAVKVTPRRLLTLMAAVGLILGAAGLLFHSLAAGAVLAPLGAAGPLLYVHFRRKARLEKMLAQLPDAFELMARIIRAGQTMAQALQAVADEFEPPISAEFAYCYEQQNLGLPPEVAFRDLARRTGLLEVKIFVLGLLIQQQTGGNLAELLDQLAGIVRERFRLRGKIKTLTAEGRMQALVLLALPPILFVIILFINPQYGQVLFDRQYLLLGTFIWEMIGALWIRQIVNFEA